MRGCLLARAASMRLCAAVLLGGALVGQSLAADIVPPRPPADSPMRGLSIPAAQRPAPPQVVWPDNGIAQRRLDGGFNYNMFVENDNGAWRAWVQSDMSEPEKKNWAKAKALDFFSGQELTVEASVYDEIQQQMPGFWDPKEAKGHWPSDRTFEFNRGTEVSGIGQGSLLTLEAERCPHALLGMHGEPSRKGNRAWSKVPLIYDKTASKGSPCEEGSYLSGFNSTLDLNDGTFLATMECWVFRLRKADLSPVGEAPALRVLEEAQVKTAVEKSKGHHIESGTAYLSKALKLHIDEAYACGA